MFFQRELILFLAGRKWCANAQASILLVTCFHLEWNTSWPRKIISLELCGPLQGCCPSSSTEMEWCLLKIVFKEVVDGCYASFIIFLAICPMDVNLENSGKRRYMYVNSFEVTILRLLHHSTPLRSFFFSFSTHFSQQNTTKMFSM